MSDTNGTEINPMRLFGRSGINLREESARNRPMARLARELTNLVEFNGGEAHAVIDMGKPTLLAA
jgi:hypothetical protein